MITGGQQVVEYKTKEDNFKIYPIGDIHIGARGVDKKGLCRVLKEIEEDPNALWIGLGDYIDAIHFLDPRFDPDQVDNTYRIADLKDVGDKSIKEVAKFFRPVKDKCIGLLTGNHEDKYNKKYAKDLNTWLSTELKVQNLEYSCFKDLLFKRRGGKDSTRVRIHAHHGAGSSVKKLKDFMTTFEADIYFVGHVHKIDTPVHTPTVITGGQRANKIGEKTKVGMVCPSYLRGYVDGKQNYVEKAAYMPTRLATGSYVQVNAYSGMLRAMV